MQEENIKRALRMLKERAKYWYKQYNKKENHVYDIAGFAYENAAKILEIAINGNVELLNTYDYYKEEDC